MVLLCNIVQVFDWSNLYFFSNEASFFKEEDRCFDKVCSSNKTEKHIHNEIDRIINNTEDIYLIRPKHQDTDDELTQKLKNLESMCW